MQMGIKAYWIKLQRKAYLNRLPKKRMGVGCLFFDRQGRILILKPTYKNHWLLPGGVIEANESPRQACIREVKEETNVVCQPTKLLCVDYVSDRLNPINRIHPINPIESVQFVFLGGTIAQETEISLGPDEISTYQFVEPETAVPMLGANSQSRLVKCLKYLDTNTTVYLENGQEQ